MRSALIWLPVIIAILICAVIALRAQVAPPPMADSDSITFTSRQKPAAVSASTAAHAGLKSSARAMPAW
jgi:hypothetical protein